MNDNDLKMLQALTEHLGHQIEQLGREPLSPMGQILIDELRASQIRLRGLSTRVSSGSVAPAAAVSAPSPVFVPSPTPAPAAIHVPAPASFAPVAEAEPARAQETTEPVPMPAPTAIPTRKTLFLIDDDGDAQKVMAYMFEKKSSFRVVSFTDPLKAWEEIKLNPPDLILMDIMMPGLSGLDLLRNIRQMAQLQSIRIVIGSSKSFDKDRVEVLKAGANDFIAKPYNFTELLLRLNKLAG